MQQGPTVVLLSCSYGIFEHPFVFLFVRLSYCWTAPLPPIRRVQAVEDHTGSLHLATDQYARAEALHAMTCRMTAPASRLGCHAPL